MFRLQKRPSLLHPVPQSLICCLSRKTGSATFQKAHEKSQEETTFAFPSVHCVQYTVVNIYYLSTPFPHPLAYDPSWMIKYD